MKEKKLTSKASTAKEARDNVNRMIMHYLRAGNWILKNEVETTQNTDGTYTATASIVSETYTS